MLLHFGLSALKIDRSQSKPPWTVAGEIESQKLHLIIKHKPCHINMLLNNNKVVLLKHK